MIDPFTAWMRLATVALDMSRTSHRASDLMHASGEVVQKRSGMMAAAMRSPVDGNYVELAKMVPEKVEAFSSAGIAVARQCWTMQLAFLAEAQHLAALFARGCSPSISELGELAARSTAYVVTSAENMAQLGAAGLAPVHRTATANARRLKRK